MRSIKIEEMILCPDEGLMLGNGDLSVSVYQKNTQIVWRFGKGDVWDRRHDLSCDPKPAHIDEVVNGIILEGWKCGPYGGPVQATKGSLNPERMKEICQGSPPSYVSRPYPGPKPVGELALHLPPDMTGLKITQELVIEENKLYISCTWRTGQKLELECFIPPTTNILSVNWACKDWNEDVEDEETMANKHASLWFSLYRWADPEIENFNSRYFAEQHCNILGGVTNDPAVTCLPRPNVKDEEDYIYIEQNFFPDPIFQEGFRYLLAPLAEGVQFHKVESGSDGEARIHCQPEIGLKHGCFTVAVTTSSDEGGAIQKLKLIHDTVLGSGQKQLKRMAEETLANACDFWAKSKVSISDKLIENLWYETLHAAKCIYKKDTISPALFFPSTVKDYSHWHGDYHTNYNYQQPFWGFLTANQLGLVDAYFEGMKFMLDIGRKIAKEYYNCRGAFIQLSGFPIKAQDDPLGAVPMGRMAYMTGWAVNIHWWRYLYTKDTEWLNTEGYPAIRDCALFYTDFLKKGDDGLYHAFPSNVGEDGFSGDPKDFKDRSQVMQHIRYCLRAAIKASEALDLDKDLRTEWYERLEFCAGDDGEVPVQLSGIEKECYELNPPEFGFGRPYNQVWDITDNINYACDNFSSFREYLKKLNINHFPYNLDNWYFGKYPWFVIQQIRSGEYIASRDYPIFTKMIEKWRRPNGLLPAMSVNNYGYAGAWTESLGIIESLQEMMLQSWDGALRIFPVWPNWVDAEYKDFRAEGAFLVSAACNKGIITNVEIYSEKGGLCYLYSPWKKGLRVYDEANNSINVITDKYGRVGFETNFKKKYYVKAVE